MAVVRRAQVSVGTSIPNVGWIDLDDLPPVNRHHFSANAQLQIGTRLGQRFLQLVRSRP
jgi:hypothetical protein